MKTTFPKEAKTIKKNTNKQVQSLLLETQDNNKWESTEKLLVDPKPGRDAHPESKGVGILPNEKHGKEVAK